MPNYVPKEKKPILNMETVKKDLQYAYAKPPMSRFMYILGFALFASLEIGVIVFLCLSKHFSDVLYALLMLVLFFPFMCGWGYAFVKNITTPIKIKKGKFYVFPDTIDHKVEHEEVKWDSRIVKKRRRYPNVLYFKKYGRYEVFYDIRDRHKERSPRLESAAKRALDEYELEKIYYVVSFSQKKPKTVMVYDPDEYDVQL